MTSAEVKLLIVIFFVIAAGSWLSRLDIRKVLTIFALGCLAGFAAQLYLGPDINRYTPNISLYISYVSVAVIFAWARACPASGWCICGRAASSGSGRACSRTF